MPTLFSLMALSAAFTRLVSRSNICSGMSHIIYCRAMSIVFERQELHRV